MLQGNLEDLPLLDIIQIVSFGKKTGYLSIQMEGGDGAIVFQHGLLVCAFTATSPLPDPRLIELPWDARENAVRSRIGFAMEQLARLREGAFGFELTERVPAKIGAREIAIETLTSGINPQEMLLQLAQGHRRGSGAVGGGGRGVVRGARGGDRPSGPMAAVLPLDTAVPATPPSPVAAPAAPATALPTAVPPAAESPAESPPPRRKPSDTLPPGARRPRARNPDSGRSDACGARAGRRGDPHHPAGRRRG